MNTPTRSAITGPTAPRRDLTRCVVFIACLGAGVGALAAVLARVCAGVAGALALYLGAA